MSASDIENDEKKKSDHRKPGIDRDDRDLDALHDLSVWPNAPSTSRCRCRKQAVAGVEMFGCLDRNGQIYKNSGDDQQQDG